MLALRFQTLGCCSSAAATGTASAFLWPWQPQERDVAVPAPGQGHGELAAASGPHSPRRGSAGSILKHRCSDARALGAAASGGLRALSSGSRSCSPLPAPRAGGVDTPGTKPASPGSSCVAVACPAAKFSQQSLRSYGAAPAARFPKKVTQGAREGPRRREEIPPWLVPCRGSYI